MSEISLEALYYFLVLSESGHYGQAAEQLFITQQALSKSISQLEERFGAELFSRQGRRKVLTPAGEALQQRARQLLNQVQQIENRFEQRELPSAGTCLKLAAPLFPRLPMMPLIKKLLRADPKLCFECQRDLLPEDMEQALLQGQLDLAFYQAPAVSQDLKSRLLSTRRFVLVAQPADAHRNWNEVSYIRYLPTFDAYDAFFWPLELHAQRIVAEADLETALRWCERGKGAMYLPESFVRHRLATGRLVKLSPPPFEYLLETYLIWNPETLAADSLASLVIQQLLKQLDDAVLV